MSDTLQVIRNSAELGELFRSEELCQHCRTVKYDFTSANTSAIFCEYFYCLEAYENYLIDNGREV